MFEQIFGSKTRVKLMKLFLENPEKKFFVRELTRLTDTLINSIRRELNNLVEVGFILIISPSDIQENAEQKGGSARELKDLAQKKFYALNKKNLFRQEFENLFSKGKVLVEKKFSEQLLATGNIRYLSLGGFFVNDKNASTDMLVVGTFDKSKVQNLIKSFEKNLGRDVRYTLMDLKEYQMRKDIADRFLNDIINNEQNMTLIDELKIID